MWLAIFGDSDIFGDIRGANGNFRLKISVAVGDGIFIWSVRDFPRIYFTIQPNQNDEIRRFIGKRVAKRQLYNGDGNATHLSNGVYGHVCRKNGDTNFRWDIGVCGMRGGRYVWDIYVEERQESASEYGKPFKRVGKN